MPIAFWAKRRRMRLWTFLLSLLLLSVPRPAFADRFLLDYDAAVFGVLSLGDVTLDVSAVGKSYVARANLRSRGLLRLFDRTALEASASGAIEASGVAWTHYDLDHSYARKRRVIAMRRTPIGAVTASITPNYREWGEPPATDAQKQESRDPLSSLVAMAVDIRRSGLCVGRYPTFDGRFRYDLVLDGGKTARFRSRSYSGSVLRCDLRYEPVAGFNPKNENERRRYPEGEIWFALDVGESLAPPVRALIPLPLGKAGLSLSGLRQARLEVSPPLTASTLPDNDSVGDR
jgi:hypothetical protein